MTHSKGFLITSMLDSQALFTSFVWDFPWMSCSCFCMQQTCPGNCIEQQLHFMFVWPPHDTRSAIVLGYTAGSSVQSWDRYQEPYWWGWTPDVSAYSHSAQPHGLSVSAKRNNKGWVCVGFQIKGQISAKAVIQIQKNVSKWKANCFAWPPFTRVLSRISFLNPNLSEPALNLQHCLCVGYAKFVWNDRCATLGPVFMCLN